MDDADPVGLMHPPRGVSNHHHLLFQRQFRGRLVQGFSGDVLHGDEELAFDLANLEHLAHMLVIHPGLRPGLDHEAQVDASVINSNELDGHFTVELTVPRQKYLPHASFAQESQKFVAIPVLHRELMLLGRAGGESWRDGGRVSVGHHKARESLHLGLAQIHRGRFLVFHVLGSRTQRDFLF